MIETCLVRAGPRIAQLIVAEVPVEWGNALVSRVGRAKAACARGVLAWYKAVFNEKKEAILQRINEQVRFIE